MPGFDFKPFNPTPTHFVNFIDSLICPTGIINASDNQMDFSNPQVGHNIDDSVLKKNQDKLI